MTCGGAGCGREGLRAVVLLDETADTIAYRFEVCELHEAELSDERVGKHRFELEVPTERQDEARITPGHSFHFELV